MRPCNTLMDHAYSSPAYPDAIRDLALSDSLGDQRADSKDVFLGKFGGGIRGPKPTSYSVTSAPFCSHVGKIVLVRPEEKMVGVAAGWYITCVANEQVLPVIVSECFEVSYTMGPYVAVGGVGEQPVPCSVYAEVPQPALAVIREHVHARPEPSRLLGAQWFECVVRHSQKVSQERIGG